MKTIKKVSFSQVLEEMRKATVSCKQDEKCPKCRFEDG